MQKKREYSHWSIVAIKEGKRRHNENPHDEAHDYSHHLRVAKNSQLIVKMEELGNKVDLNVLLTAAWWHDIQRDEEAVNASEEAGLFLKSIKAPPEFISSVTALISSHTFGKKQESLEARVLWDADKLDYVEKERFVSVKEAVLSGEMSTKEFKYYQKLWCGRIAQIAKSFYFNSSNALFAEKYNDVYVYINEEEVYKNWRMDRIVV